IRSAPARWASATCSPKRAKSAARMDGAILMTSSRISRISFIDSCSASLSARILKNAHKLPIAAGNLRDSGVPSNLLRAPLHKRIPETRSAHRETDETRHGGCCAQPFPHLLVVLSTAQNDAAYLIAPAATRCSHDLFAVLTAVEPLDFPHIGLHLRILQFLDGLDHQSRTKLQIVGLLVSLEPIELPLLRWHQQLEHETAASLGP